jgi:mono/diheme cytochrome c family protein
MKFSLIAVMSVAVIGGTALAASAQDAKVEAGKTAYTTQKCSMCHSIKGVGMKPPTGFALDGVGTKVPAADIKKWITDPAAMEAKLTPKPKMSMAAAMKSKKLTDADVDALVAYMLSLK